jgi:hypothetical protein
MKHAEHRSAMAAADFIIGVEKHSSIRRGSEISIVANRRRSTTNLPSSIDA